MFTSMTLGEQSQSVYRNRLQMTAPLLTKNGFIWVIFCIAEQWQILSNQA